MARQTCPHIVVDQLLRSIDLRHIAVAGDALYIGPDVRGMIELDQSFLLEAVDTNPGDLAPFRSVFGNLFDLRLVGRDFRMAKHALLHRRNGSGWTNISHAVAIDALEAESEVLFVRIGDGLVRRKRRKRRT